MFLFTTPTAAPRPADTGNPVVDAIRKGADRTGADFSYLLSTARRESSLDPSAKAPTSSATGLFQFIEQTWLSVFKQAGAENGMPSLADAITSRGGGALGVDDPATKQAILDLRKDPAVASVMAGVLTQQNRDALSASLGRDPNAGELYAAHVLGARGAADLIRTAGQNPARTAASDFPDAAAANRGIFYDRGGRARSASEVYAALGASASSAGVPAATDPAATTPPAVAATGMPGLSGLFQTGRAAPISDAVARIWRTNNGGAAPPKAAGSFFPRTETASLDAGDSAAAAPVAVAVAAGDDAAAGPPAPVPLPPPRPAGYAATRGARP